MSTKLRKLQSRVQESQIENIMIKDYEYLTAQYNDCVASNNEAKRIEAAAARLAKDKQAYYPAKANVPREVIIRRWCTPTTYRLIMDNKICGVGELLSSSEVEKLAKKKPGVPDGWTIREYAQEMRFVFIKCKLWKMAGYVCKQWNTLMESSETKHLRLTPAQRRRMLMEIDIPIYLQDMPRHISRKDFISENFDTYRLCIESWVCLLREGISPSTQPGNKRLSLDEARINFYLDLMLRKGLICLILDAKEASDAFIAEVNGGSFMLPITNPFFEDVQLWRIKGEDPASVLQILRYPKRLSISGTTAAAYEAAFEFKRLNREHRLREMFNWSSYQWHYVLKVRRVIEKMFEDAEYSTLGVQDILEVAVEHGYFSSGAVTGTSQNCIAAKAVQSELEGVMVGSNAVYGSTFTDNVNKRHYKSASYGSTSSGSYTDLSRRKTRYSEFHTVPKTAWSVRAICYEQAGRQFLQQGFRALLEDVTDTFGCVDLHDQSKNREACILGSKYRDTVTVDLSHASDSIGWKHYVDCFPNWMVDTFFQLRAPKIRMFNEEFRNNVAWTSGAGLCFFCETIFFLAVAIAAIMEERENQGKRPWPTKAELARCKQYGDDGIYPTEYAENIVRVLSLLGFAVNTSKSYCSKTDAYRESCGEEAYDGKLLSSNYFPRKPMDLDTDERLLSLISLQHRFFDSPTMGLFFIKAVESVKKNAITCLPYAEDSTPWYMYDIPQVYYAMPTQSLYIKAMRFETVYSSALSKELDRVGEILGYGQFLKFGTHVDYEGGLRIVKPLNHRSLSGKPEISCSIAAIPFVIGSYPVTFKCDDEVITLTSDTELQQFCKKKVSEPAKPKRSTQGNAQNARPQKKTEKEQKLKNNVPNKTPQKKTEKEQKPKANEPNKKSNNSNNK